MTSPSTKSYYPGQRRTDWRAVSLFIVGISLIVIVPVAVAHWPRERARWLIAAAENELQNSKNETDSYAERARQKLAQAKKLDPDVVRNPNYIAIDFMAGPLRIDRAMELLELDEGPSRRRTAFALSNLFYRQKKFEQAYELLKRGFPRLEERTIEENNQIAYCAALAGKDLDEALASIDQALNMIKRAALLDTKAWVLFRKERFDEALQAINEAIVLEATERDAVELTPTERGLVDALFAGKPPFSTDSAVTETALSKSPAAKNVIMGLVIYRFHRAEILKAMDRATEAKSDYEWLNDRGFDDYAELY